MIGRMGIDDIAPLVSAGQQPAKAVVGEYFPVSTTAWREGHDALGVTLHVEAPRRGPFDVRMVPAPEPDTFNAAFVPDAVGFWSYRIEAWSDPYATWRSAVLKKLDAGQGAADLANDIETGARVLDTAADLVAGDDRELLLDAARQLRARRRRVENRVGLAVSDEVVELLTAHPVRELVTKSRTYRVWVDRKRALFGSWYELFPRSTGGWDGEGNPVHGTFLTAAQDLPRIADMGFDVVYLPPIHPIGEINRKGPNNTLVAGPEDVGSPWAIGSSDGGHDAIHPLLGTEEDFEYFVGRARELGLEVALDLALQCAPDHPWALEHPEWFTTQPDGTIAFAENPPKKYQDIYPLNFDNDPGGLAQAVLDVVRGWVARGVHIFRVDNPHTKPLWFWEWLIAKVRAEEPRVVFLAEAFTRPAMMHALGKVGFQQSYGYFTWRNTAEELAEYLQEISHETPAFYRPNLFVNTPDILTEYLQHGGPGAFRIRAVVAATASPLWGVYAGFELFEHVARPGAEEYIDNEKYEYRPRDWEGAEAAGASLAPYLTRLNEIRAAHPALGDLQNLTLHASTHPDLLVFSKTRSARPEGAHRDAEAVTDAGPAEDTLIVVVTTNPHDVVEATLDLDLEALRLRPEDRDASGAVEVEDLLTGQRWQWGRTPYVRLDPNVEPAHVLRVVRNG